MKLIVKTDKHAAAFKRMKEILAKAKMGIKNAQSNNNEQLKQHGLDPENLEGSLKNSKLSEPDKKRLLDQLHAAQPNPASQSQTSASRKKPKTSPKRLNV